MVELVLTSNQPMEIFNLVLSRKGKIWVSIMSKKNRSIRTGGGTYIEGDVKTGGGDFIGRDQINIGLDVDTINQSFEAFSKRIEERKNSTSQEKALLKSDIEAIRQELLKGEKVESSFVIQRLRNIGRMAPDILEVMLATFINPALGFGVIAHKIAERITKENSLP